MNKCQLTAVQSAHYNRTLGLLQREQPEGGIVSVIMGTLHRLVAPQHIQIELLPLHHRMYIHLDHHPANSAPVPASRIPTVLDQLLRLYCTSGTPFPVLILHASLTEVALLCRTGRGLVCCVTYRTEPFTLAECWMLRLLHPHLELALNRSAHYALLPCTEPLTLREREVLHWIVQGKKDEEIAQILNCCHRTITNHVHTLLRKLNVESRLCAARCVLCNYPVKGAREW